jgi:hypothetical protein
MRELDRRARAAARRYLGAEAELLGILQELDQAKGFRDFGHPSLMAYAVRELGLSEAVALNLINVARKAIHVPELKTAIETGGLSVPVARKIVPVVTSENQAEWIEKAKRLTTRELEREVARVRPELATPERIKYVSESRAAVSLGLDEAALRVVRRVQDLESQRLRRAATLEEAIAAMGEAYLEKHDPLKKAERAKVRAEQAEKRGKLGPGPAPAPKQEPADAAAPVTGLASRERMEATLKHQATLRDGARCAHRDADGTRCDQRRWLDIHHVVPVARGGRNTVDNLVTLCRSHHALEHRAG